MVLKIDASGLTPAEFGDSDSAEVGDSVWPSATRWALSCAAP